MLAASTTGENNGRCGADGVPEMTLLQEPASHFRILQAAASHLLHHGTLTSVPTW
jgi:hypothetical protein